MVTYSHLARNPCIWLGKQLYFLTRSVPHAEIRQDGADTATRYT